MKCLLDLSDECTNVLTGRGCALSAPTAVPTFPENLFLIEFAVVARNSLVGGREMEQNMLDTTGVTYLVPGT